MSSELSHRDILATLDSIECDIHTSYKRLLSLRSKLKEQWRVQNAPGYWPEEPRPVRHEETGRE